MWFSWCSIMIQCASKVYIESGVVLTMRIHVAGRVSGLLSGKSAAIIMHRKALFNTFMYHILTKKIIKKWWKSMFNGRSIVVGSFARYFVISLARSLARSFVCLFVGMLARSLMDHMCSQSVVRFTSRSLTRPDGQSVGQSLGWSEKLTGYWYSNWPVDL